MNFRVALSFLLTRQLYPVLRFDSSEMMSKAPWFIATVFPFSASVAIIGGAAARVEVETMSTTGSAQIKPTAIANNFVILRLRLSPISMFIEGT